jgi:uncharacterized protein YndB with AHSA1/START domain
MKKLEISNTIRIQAPASKVWNALTNPTETKKYMFGCETVSDWKVGSTLLWKMIHEGKEFIPVKGIVVAIETNHFLAYTTFDPHANMPDIPENYLTVSYTLKEENGETLLTVVQGDYAGVANGERRYKEAFNQGEGWNPILVQIKELIELG